MVNAVNDLRNAIKKQEKLLENPKKLGHEAIKRSPLGEISKILIKIAVGKETEELRNFYTHSFFYRSSSSKAKIRRRS
ncbi:hypothetical protein [Sulfurisphaera javensis]|uniref:hypothetical protein n=1 Tax=Sulfurisphaera javensis TaxID=2049879 RepID=UPI0034E8F8C5